MELLFGVVKLVSDRSADFAISLDRCSKMYRPLVVVSLIAVVLVELTRPFTRKATTATISRHATPSPTTISTIVKPTGGFPWRFPSPSLSEFSDEKLMEPT